MSCEVQLRVLGLPPRACLAVYKMSCSCPLTRGTALRRQDIGLYALGCPHQPLMNLAHNQCFSNESPNGLKNGKVQGRENMGFGVGQSPLPILDLSPLGKLLTA